MASIASLSNSSTASHEGPRPEAGPLPAKRGEIGYVEGVDGHDEEARTSSPETVLPARHPADRDGSTTTLNPMPTSATPRNTPPSSSTISLSSTVDSTIKKKRLFCFLKPKNVPSFGGLLLTTLLIFIIQCLFAVGTITGWVLAARSLTKPQSGGFGPSSAIFVHVLFGVGLLGQLLFLERRIFRLRAERYSYLHPGEILPSSRSHGVADSSIAFSPWNRPPLPTYAAALAQSGVGTGDVEDHLIAAPPPPAYGNTRGSTMLLAGYLRDSLRAQRPLSIHSQMSHRDERPISYVSRDEQWEEVQNAERARQLENTLSRLERPGSVS